MINSNAKFKIPQNVLKQTTDCQKNLSCLFNQQNLLQVESRLTLLFVQSETCENCSYRMPFGNSFTCTCPTRKVIYERYQK